MYVVKQDAKLTLQVSLVEEPPPPGASAGVDDGPDELAPAQLHSLHVTTHLCERAEGTQQQQRQHWQTQRPHDANLNQSLSLPLLPTQTLTGASVCSLCLEALCLQLIRL